MMQRLVGKLFVVLATITPFSAIAQQFDRPDEQPLFPAHVDPKTQVVVEVYTDGKHRVYKTAQVRLYEVFGNRLFLWLLLQDIGEELELTQSQRRVLSDLRIDVAHLRDDLTPIVAAATRAKNQLTDKDVAAAVTNFKQKFQEVEDSLEDALSRKQADRVRELLARKHWIERGIQGSMQGSSYASDDAGRERLENLLANQKELIRQRTDEYRATVFRDVIALLTPEQVTGLIDSVGDGALFLNHNLEVLTFQSQHASRGIHQQFASHMDEYRRTAYPLGVSLAGGLEPLDIGDPRAFEQFMTLCRAGYYGNANILSYQVAAIVNQGEEFVAQVKKMREAQEAIDRRLVITKNLTFTEAMDAKIAVVDKFTAWKLGRLESEEVLLPHQVAEIQAICLRRNLAQRGIHACLVNGMLGQKLKITEDQSESILSAARDAAEQGRKLTRRLENAIWDEVRSLLNKQDRDALAVLVGPPPEYLGGAPTLLLDRISASRR